MADGTDFASLITSALCVAVQAGVLAFAAVVCSSKKKKIGAPEQPQVSISPSSSIGTPVKVDRSISPSPSPVLSTAPAPAPKPAAAPAPARTPKIPVQKEGESKKEGEEKKKVPAKAKSRDKTLEEKASEFAQNDILEGPNIFLEHNPNEKTVGDKSAFIGVDDAGKGPSRKKELKDKSVLVAPEAK
ncbi:hypothetical protein QR680_008846 [Steinernema hermaphroditum]|uniref:Uncharacterized protein n=1 Tax=Steinernema hermaphroditum TaxID=289476 RepID=A0AA39M8M3_9BILA|nr:hypothetical protein QR680_008846 [Steinernema hermaphroditum]